MQTVIGFIFGIALTVAFLIGVYVGIKIRSFPVVGGVAEAFLDTLFGGGGDTSWF